VDERTPGTNSRGVQRGWTPVDLGYRGGGIGRGASGVTLRKKRLLCRFSRPGQKTQKKDEKIKAQKEIHINTATFYFKTQSLKPPKRKKVCRKLRGNAKRFKPNRTP